MKAWSQWLRGHNDLTENEDLRLWVQSIASMPAIFQSWIAKKINKALSVWLIVICCDLRLLRRNSYKDVDHALTLPESILHKIIGTFISSKNVPFFTEIGLYL